MPQAICPKCDSEIPIGFKFCGNCGQKLDAVVQHMQAAPRRRDPWGQDRLSAPLVGRDAELRELVERWGSARGGEPWIEVRGEMGIGKTRLVKEAAIRIEGRRLLAVAAGSGTKHRPFGMARRLVQAVVCEVTGQASPPDTHAAFVAVLAQLGHNLTPFVDAFWCLAEPSQLSAPVLGPHPQMLRWSLERGMAILLTRLTEQVADLTLFFDAYELADEASVALFKSLNMRSGGWPMPVVVASRDEGRASLRPEAGIRLAPLADDEAVELLDHLTRGAELPETLRQNVLAHAAGVPLRIEEMVRLLVDQGVLTPTDDGSSWSCDPKKATVNLSVSHHVQVVARLEQAARDLLGQCAVQGSEFDPDVIETVQQRLGWQGPPVRMLLSRLERRGLVQHTGSDPWTQGSFSHSLVQAACYEALSPPDRRVLHGKTAEVLCELASGQEPVPPELLAYHYERAEHWTLAAEANLRAGDRAAELFLNDAAVRRYRRVVALIDLLKAPPEEAVRLVILAHGGAARVHLRVGAYMLAEEAAKKMRTLAIRPGDRAEADRLTASAYVHTGRVDEAESLLLGTVASARDDDAANSVLASTLCDLAELYCNVGRTSAALERLRECRASARSENSLTFARADCLEGRIVRTTGRLADAMRLYARAYEAAQRAGNLSELSHASSGMGHVAYNLGDYDSAQRHYGQALKLWELTGDAEWIAGAYTNLGNLAMSRGDFEEARGRYERALVVCRTIGNLDRSALAKANFAASAFEEGDFPSAVASAEASLATLSDTGGNALLRGWVLALLGEGRLECGDALGAQREFDQILRDYDEAHHMHVVARAWRGLGRVALMRGATVEALDLLERAIEEFQRLRRTQEAARTSLYRAVALRQLGESQRACSELERVYEQFISMGADRDAGRVELLLRELHGASRSQ